MNKKKIKMETKNKNIKSFDKHLDERYGVIGTKERTDFEIKAKSFAIGELIKEERKLAHMTQEQLAEKIKNDPQLKAEVGNDRPALLIDVVKNKTSEHIDTEAITDTLKININKSMLFSIISRERNDLLLNEQKLAQSGLSDKDKVAQLGKLFGAKYVLYGSFSSITNMVNSQKQTYYKLNLSILNIETGQEVFIDEAELNKISKKSMF
jgi:uncharacterized protein (TIGR02722 family)